METLGQQSKTLFLKEENHKLHHEFTVATGQEVKRGQPVKLNATGEIVPAAADDLAKDIIGISIHNASADEQATVNMKAKLIIFAMPNAALDAGPVAYDGLNDENDTYNSFKAAGADATKLVGWALDQSLAEDEEIRVAIV